LPAGRWWRLRIVRACFFEGKSLLTNLHHLLFNLVRNAKLGLSLWVAHTHTNS
jgi:hypothetical protein